MTAKLLHRYHSGPGDGGCCYFRISVDQMAGALMLSGLLLCLVHSAGLVYCLYLVTSGFTNMTGLRFCTEALFCLVYLALPGRTGIAVQLLGSFIGLLLNILLIVAVWKNTKWALLIGLVSYVVTVVGCLFLGVVLVVALIQKGFHSTLGLHQFMLPVVSLLLATLYAAYSFLIYRVWKNQELSIGSQDTIVAIS